VEDTVLDLVAKARTFDDAYGWIAGAVGRRLTSPQLLGKALANRSRMRWRAWITAALADAAEGVHSPLERNYVNGVERAHGLPTARRQAKRRQGSGTRYLDNLYEGYDLCVEVDGLVAHPPEGRWRDIHRDNANLVQGTETLRYGWPDATENRCRTAAEIAVVLRRRGWKGTLLRCGPDCTAARPDAGARPDAAARPNTGPGPDAGARPNARPGPEAAAG
jgi:very-short-patch-repair endonuclease